MMPNGAEQESGGDHKDKELVTGNSMIHRNVWFFSYFSVL